MRIRSIKPDFFKHDRLGTLPPLARLCFVGLWCMADGEGRLEDRPTRIKVEILPYDSDANVEDLLQALADGGHIVRYTVGDQRLIAIPSWQDHQRISGKEAQISSRFPPPPTGGKQRGSSGEAWVAQEGKGMGKERNGERAAHACGEPAGAASPPPSVAFPVFDCVAGRKSRERTWRLPDALAAELTATFPGVDVAKQLREAWGWCRTHSTQRKTASGMPGFLFRWMTREQNQSQRRSNGAKPPRGADEQTWLAGVLDSPNEVSP